MKLQIFPLAWYFSIDHSKPIYSFRNCPYTHCHRVKQFLQEELKVDLWNQDLTCAILALIADYYGQERKLGFQLELYFCQNIHVYLLNEPKRILFPNATALKMVRMFYTIEEFCGTLTREYHWQECIVSPVYQLLRYYNTRVIIFDRSWGFWLDTVEIIPLKKNKKTVWWNEEYGSFIFFHLMYFQDILSYKMGYALLKKYNDILISFKTPK